MKNLNSASQLAIASLIGLAILHLVQLGAIFAQLELSPPLFVAPLIGTAISIQLATIPLLVYQHKSRFWWMAAVILTAIPSVGPQKFFSADALILSPMIVCGTAFTIILIGYVLMSSKGAEQWPEPAPAS